MAGVSFVPCVCWVPKGAATEVPDKVCTRIMSVTLYHVINAQSSSVWLVRLTVTISYKISYECETLKWTPSHPPQAAYACQVKSGPFCQHQGAF